MISNHTIHCIPWAGRYNIWKHPEVTDVCQLPHCPWQNPNRIIL